MHGVIERLFLRDTLTAVVSGEAVGWVAAELRTKHYDAKTRVLSLADCFPDEIVDRVAKKTGQPRDQVEQRVKAHAQS